MSQLSFASMTPKTKSKLRPDQFLDDMRKVVPWRKIARLIKPFYYNSSTGRPPYDLILMIKVHCLQQWYNLSDLGMEEAIYDRLSFQRFLDIDLMNDRIPDKTTILHFRHLLDRCDLMKKIFKLINKHLEEKGLMMKEGTIVDATIINSTSSTKNKDSKRDPEMKSTKKNNQWYFGMKSHIGIDAKSGLVHTCEVSLANTSDVEMTIDLLHGEERAIFGDRGYVNKEDKKWARKQGIFWVKKKLWVKGCPREGSEQVIRRVYGRRHPKKLILDLH